MLIKWETPAGLVKETNNLKATVDYCESLGWCQITGGEVNPGDGDGTLKGSDPDTDPKPDKKKSRPKVEKGSREPEAAE